MINFTVGPVMSPESVLRVSAHNAPYFRTQEFSEVMLASEQMMLKLLSAPKNSRCIFLTASGTGAMEAAVMSVLKPMEHVAVVNGGSFGQRFVDLCKLHSHSVEEVNCEFGKQITEEQLKAAISSEVTALLVNMNETSSGLLYNMRFISEYCKAFGLLLIVDAVSAFIADQIDMNALGADVMLTGSQKALACHPGISIIALSDRAIERVWANPEECMYLSLREALKNGERGQTPWTPAVTTLLEIRQRLGDIDKRGIDFERSEIARRANVVRNIAEEIGLRLVAENPSNAVSAFWCTKHNAKDIILTAQNDYNMWLCPNGGKLADDVFRIGHIGAISEKENDLLVFALRDMSRRGIL